MKQFLKKILKRQTKKKSADFTVKVEDFLKFDESKVTKKLEGVGKDIHEKLVKGSEEIHVVKRFFNNGDVFLYFSTIGNESNTLTLEFDSEIEYENFDSHYEKPPFSNRYGENEITGPGAYITTNKFNAMISKIYKYKELIKNYDSSTNSTVLELVEESDEIKFEKNRVTFTLEECKKNTTFSMLITKEKLFTDRKNLDGYIKYFYQNLKNNSVQSCTFFNTHSGAITKLPYSIEPFTKKGYGFNLHHSSRHEMTHLYRTTNERFYFGMLSNAVMQSLLYRPQKNGVFFTEYTSTWIKKDSGITSPYIDTRLNEAFSRMMEDYKVFNPELKENCLENYLDYVTKYFESNRPSYRSENGVFFPDYFKEGSDVLTHASLNHQIGIATLYYKMFVETNKQDKLTIFNMIISFIDDTHKEWINPKTGDLFYGCKVEKDKIIYLGEDYTYVTLIDLLIIQLYQMKITQKESIGVKYLIEKKLAYLKTTEYCIFKPKSELASGETLDSKMKVRKYLHEIDKLKQGIAENN